MTIDMLIDSFALLPTGIKLASAITVLFVAIACHGMRPGDPTL